MPGARGRGAIARPSRGPAALSSAEGTAEPRRNERPLQVPTTAASAPGWARQLLSLCRPGRGPGLRGARGVAGPPGLLAGPAGAVPEAATASPPPTAAPLPRAGTCRTAGRDPAPEETPSAGRQAGRRSSTGSRPRPPAVPRATPVSAWLRRTTNRTPTFTLMPRSAPWLRRRLSVLGGGDHGRPLEAEDRPLPLRPPPPLPHRPQAVAAAADPTRPDPTLHADSRQAGLYEHLGAAAHRALLNTKESLTVTTGPSSGHSESWYWLQSSHPANRRPASERTARGGGPPKGAVRLPAGWDCPAALPTNMKQCEPRTCPRETHPACRVTHRVTENEIFPRNGDK